MERRRQNPPARFWLYAKIAPPRARRGRAACGVPQLARRRSLFLAARRKRFRTRRFAVRVCGVLPYRLAWKKRFGLGASGWRATQVRACGARAERKARSLRSQAVPNYVAT
jgi:hypothetical protein